MTLDQLNQTIYLLNAAKISQRQKSAVLGIALEAILHDGDVDVQDMFRRYAGVDEDIARFCRLPTFRRRSAQKSFTGGIPRGATIRSA